MAIPARLPFFQYTQASNRTLVGGLLYSYLAGTDTPSPLYTDATGDTAHPNPVVLDADGSKSLWIDENLSYKFVLKTATGSLLKTWDRINDDPINMTDLSSTDSGKGAVLVGADDGASGSLWTTVQGFINKIISKAGSSAVGFVQSFTGATSSTVQDELRETVSLFHFMSSAQKSAARSGDPVDVTLALRTAILAIEDVNLERRPFLTVPYGDFYLEDIIEILTDGMRIIGAGNAAPFDGLSVYSGGTKFTYAGAALDTATQGVFMFGSASNQCRGLRISGVTIDAADIGNAIWGTQLNGSEISRVTTLQATNGIYLTGSNNNSNTIESCLFYDPPTGGGVIALRGNAHSNDIVRCQFGNKSTGDRNPKYGVEIARDANCSAVNIVGTNFDYYRVEKHAHFVTDCKGFSFFGNYIEARGDGLTRNLLVFSGGSGGVVCGNRFTKNDSPIPTNIDYGINAESGAEDIGIYGNYFSGFNTACVRIASGAKNINVGPNATNGLTDVVNQNALGSKKSFTCNYGNVVTDSVSTEKIIHTSSGTLVISGGVITVNGSFHRVDTEGGASTDNLDTINGGVDGMVLHLSSFNSSRDIVIKDGTGNIACGTDFTLTNARDKISLIYDESVSAWCKYPGSSN